MALPPAHMRLVFNFTLLQAAGGGSDIAEFTLSLPANVGGEMAAATAADTAFRPRIVGDGMGISVNAVYNSCRAQSIGADGKVVASAVAAGGSPIAGDNGSMGSTLTCKCITMNTNARDAKGTLIYGRFFPPALPVGPIGSTFTAATVSTYVTAWAGTLSAIQAALPGTPTYVVPSSTGLGLVPATHCSASNIQDTQRRRKNNVTIVQSGQVAI